MRLPADEIGHPRRDRLLHDEVVGEARQRTPDENQQRHGQKFAAMGRAAPQSGLVERNMSTSAPTKRRIVTSISETIRLIVINAARKGQTCRQ